MDRMTKAKREVSYRTVEPVHSCGCCKFRNEFCNRCDYDPNANFKIIGPLRHVCDVWEEM